MRLGVVAAAFMGILSGLCALGLMSSSSLRHTALAWAHSPARLEALKGQPLVRYDQAEARPCAEAAARMLPEAMERVAAFHGAPFARQPVVMAYSDPARYASANGVGEPSPRATSLGGRVSLSPALCAERGEELRAVLTHELSHAHLQGRLGGLAFARIPAWLHEGLATLAADGGGARRVSDAEARRAILEGRRIHVADRTSWLGFPFDPPQPAGLTPGDLGLKSQMVYRQAALFLGDLRARDERAFAGLLARLRDGEAFSEAFRIEMGLGVDEAWERFSSSLAP